MALSSANQGYYNGGHDGTYSGVTSPQETEKLTGDNVKLLPKMAMSTKASSNGDDSGNSIEYGKRFLPPLWVDL